MLRELDRIHSGKINVSERCKEKWMEILPKLVSIDEREGEKATALVTDMTNGEVSTGLCHIYY